MIRGLTFNLRLTISELRILANNRSASWDKPPVDIVPIKTRIREQLLAHQKNCAYCGLPLWETSEGQIDHIAPKSRRRYPRFTFTLRNLVYACSHCNGFRKKSSKNTIATVHKLYSRCTFSIVHPYDKDFDNHFHWVEGIQIFFDREKCSREALNSIKMFQLELGPMIEGRAKDIMTLERKKKLQLSTSQQQQIDRALSFIP